MKNAFQISNKLPSDPCRFVLYKLSFLLIVIEPFSGIELRASLVHNQVCKVMTMIKVVS